MLHTDRVLEGLIKSLQKNLVAIERTCYANPFLHIFGQICCFNITLERKSITEPKEKVKFLLPCMARCQFDQRFLCAFFVQIFGTRQNVTRENGVRTKNLYVKRWWNWQASLRKNRQLKICLDKEPQICWPQVVHPSPLTHSHTHTHTHIKNPYNNDAFWFQASSM